MYKKPRVIPSFTGPPLSCLINAYPISMLIRDLVWKIVNTLVAPDIRPFLISGIRPDIRQEKTVLN